MEQHKNKESLAIRIGSTIKNNKWKALNHSSDKDGIYED